MNSVPYFTDDNYYSDLTAGGRPPCSEMVVGNPEKKGLPEELPTPSRKPDESVEAVVTQRILVSSNEDTEDPDQYDDCQVVFREKFGSKKIYKKHHSHKRRKIAQ